MGTIILSYKPQEVNTRERERERDWQVEHWLSTHMHSPQRWLDKRSGSSPSLAEYLIYPLEVSKVSSCLAILVPETERRRRKQKTKKGKKKIMMEKENFLANNDNVNFQR